MTATHTFDDKDSRDDDMSEAIESWLQDLSEGVDDARTSEQFTEYLDVMSNFHTYSRNNQHLIAIQCPNATRVAGYNTWQDEFNRTVEKGESAIWIWAPIITDKCPDCGNSEKYHNIEDCDSETDPDDWNSGVVGFRPVPVFDVSQTEGEDLPELDTAAHGEADGLVSAVLTAADRLGVPDVTITNADDWTHGTAKGTSHKVSGEVDIRDCENTADKACTMVHEFAHSMLHAGEDKTPDKEAKEVEAESVAYVVGRHFGLDVSGSTFYLASWAGENTDEIEARLSRISSTAQDIISAIEEELEADETEQADAEAIPA